MGKLLTGSDIHSIHLELNVVEFLLEYLQAHLGHMYQGLEASPGG